MPEEGSCEICKKVIPEKNLIEDDNFRISLDCLESKNGESLNFSDWLNDSISKVNYSEHLTNLPLCDKMSLFLLFFLLSFLEYYMAPVFLILFLTFELGDPLASNNYKWHKRFLIYLTSVFLLTLLFSREMSFILFILARSIPYFFIYIYVVSTWSLQTRYLSLKNKLLSFFLFLGIGVILAFFFFTNFFIIVLFVFIIGKNMYEKKSI